MKKIFMMFTILIFLFGINNVCASERIQVTLNKCVDGDTAWFNLNKEKTKFRFLALDTPESTNKIEPYGKEASKYTCDILTNAQIIEIEYDKNSNKTDKYGRNLAWIFIDGKLLQSSIIENGLGEVDYLYGDYKYTDILKEKQNEAKENKLNIWSEEETNLEDNKTLMYIAIAVIIIACIFNKSYRKKIINKSKKQLKKKLDSFL